MPQPHPPTSAPTGNTDRSGRRHLLMRVMLVVCCAWLLMAVYQAYKPMPQGLSVSAPLRSGTGLQLLDDHTFVAANGEQVIDQQIFDEVFRLIGQARQLIVLDMFLYNEFAGGKGYKPLTDKLTDELLAARQRRPNMPIVLITDPFNTLYGGLPAPHLDRLEQAGITLVVSDVSQLPASNTIWSGLWHLCCRYIDNSTEGGWLPNPVGEGRVTLRSYLALLNFRANHRKTLIVDEGDTWTGLVTSANPHEASSRHSNNALVFRGEAALDLLASEIPVMAFSGSEATFAWPRPPLAAPKVDEPMVQVLTESRIRDALVALINSSQTGDQLDLEVFYLSHRPTIAALTRASERGVAVRALLDPNKDAFGRQKNGIPNRQSGWDLHAAGVEVRWCATQGEQCHRKWIRLTRADGSAEMIIGSANFTRRNLDDLNLETSMRVVAAREAPIMRRASELFERNWSNPGADLYSLPYQEFSDHSRWRYWLYRVMELSGLSTF